MWIVLGSLIAVVIGFILITSIFDKKKQKRKNEAKKAAVESSNQGVMQVSIFIELLVKYNDLKLKEFVPGKGDLKMSDIRTLAKKQIDNMQQTAFYKKLIKDSDNVKKLEEYLQILKKTNSNMWAKRCQKEIKSIISFQKNYDPKTFDEFRTKQEDKLKKLYK